MGSTDDISQNKYMSVLRGNKWNGLDGKIG